MLQLEDTMDKRIRVSPLLRTTCVWYYSIYIAVPPTDHTINDRRGTRNLCTVSSRPVPSLKQMTRLLSCLLVRSLARSKRLENNFVDKTFSLKPCRGVVMYICRMPVYLGYL